ncbi:MAG TPA: hypothetical protein VE547_05015 [Mycobacteriales bacterium]|nr:hypothetical protein [Mycobacteriales bacterium]
MVFTVLRRSLRRRDFGEHETALALADLAEPDRTEAEEPAAKPVSAGIVKRRAHGRVRNATCTAPFG